MKQIIKLLLIISLPYLYSCESNKVNGVYSSNEGPYFKFENDHFEFGVPGDPNPLKGNYFSKGNSIELNARSVILGSYAETNFICHLDKDTLLIDVLHIIHPKFEIFINKPDNFAKTKKDTVVTEFKLDSPEAESELFIYYKLVFDRFIKKEGG